MDKPIYISPFARGHKNYSATIKQFNHALQTRVAQALREDVHWRYEGATIYTTGSDGRFEKGPVSGLEFCILVKDIHANRRLGFLLSHLSRFKPSLIERFIEVKVLGRDNMSRYDNDPDRVYPMRIMDLAHLDGTQDLDKEAKLLMVQEWIGDGGKGISNRVKSRKSEYKKVSRTGKHRFNQDTNIKHYDLNSGIAFFDVRDKKLSFKQGPLRYVQTALMQDIITRYRLSSNPNEDSLVLDLPANTVDKFLYLEAHDLIATTHSETEDLVDIYAYFLWQYHRSQEEFRLRGNKELVFDIKEVKERLEDLEKILGKRIIKID